MVKELINLYIKYEHFNTNFIQYDLYKFKYNQNIGINYRTPTIYLNGLFFYLPYGQLVSIKRNKNLQTFNLKLKIVKDEITPIEYTYLLNLFKKIKSYNQDYFELNKHKFKIRCKRTHKSNEIIKKSYGVNKLKNEINKNYLHNIDDNNININKSSTITESSFLLPNLNKLENSVKIINEIINTNELEDKYEIKKMKDITYTNKGKITDYIANNIEGNIIDNDITYNNKTNNNEEKVTDDITNNEGKVTNGVKNNEFIKNMDKKSKLKDLIYTEYSYDNFYYFDENDNIILDLEIKQLYFKKILNQVITNLKLSNDETDETIENSSLNKHKINYYTDILNYLENNVIDKRNNLYFKDFIKDNIFLNLKFYVKSNNFTTNFNKIVMKWKICDYHL